MAKIIGINGILSHGENGTDKVLSDLSKLGYNTLDFDYPIRNTFTAWSNKNRWSDADRLLDVYSPGDHVIAHSYGCLVVLEAMRKGIVLDNVFFFGAAASSNAYPWFPLLPQACKRLFVIYNPKDKALKLGSMIPRHPFGKLGLTGYSGPNDSRIINQLGSIDSKSDLLDHNLHLGDNKNRKLWVKYIDDRLRKATGAGIYIKCGDLQ